MQQAYKSLIMLAVVLWPVSALAITLTNRDSTDQKLIVIEGDAQNERVIKAGEKVELCPKSCVIRVPDGEDYEFDGPEIVSLEEGLLFLDGTDDQGKSGR